MQFLNVALAAFVLAIVNLSSRGQAVNPIPNASFETWSGDCVLDGWAINSICEANLRPITRTTTAQAGQFAVRGEVVSFFNQAFQPVLQAGNDANGFPITQTYSGFSGFYQFAPIGGDRMSLNVALYKGTIEEGTLVAHGAKTLPAAAAYTEFSLSLVTMTNEVPDRAYIQIMIIGPVTGADYHVGSVMYVDNLSFGAATTGPEARLTIARNGANVVVSWPVDLTGYKLQSTTSLNPVDWQDVPGLTANDRTYSFTPSTPIYFRLLKPAS
jgi:hypothetical protein